LNVAGGIDEHFLGRGWGAAVISPDLLRRRNGPLIVRREDALRPGRRTRSRRARRRVTLGSPTRTGAIAVGVLLLAAVAWLLVFAYLVTLVHY
jgi:hypothetical protein